MLFVKMMNKCQFCLMCTSLSQSKRKALTDITNVPKKKKKQRNKSLPEPPDFDEPFISDDEDADPEFLPDLDDELDIVKPMENPPPSDQWKVMLPPELREDSAWVEFFDQQIRNCGKIRRWSTR